jgi:glycosyltransferase involved in cell wall biosynthesis
MKPRVLMIAYACNPEGGGEHWLGWGWAEQAAKNFSVDLITTTNASAAVEKHARALGITPHFIGTPNWWRTLTELTGTSWLRKVSWQRRTLKLAAQLHTQRPFELVHQTTFHTFRVPFLAAGLGIPSVWGPIAGGERVPPGFETYLGPAKGAEARRQTVNRLSLRVPSVKRSLENARALFVSNRTTLEFLPDKVREKSKIVAPNALRPRDESFSPPTAKGKPGPFRLLYAGNCVATRSIPLVLDALDVSGLEDFEFKIIGDGLALDEWRRLAARSRMEEQVKFLGKIPHAQLNDYYSTADALVFPALRDSGGSALLEAMARYLPVVCLDWAGPGEMVDEKSGIKIPVTNPAETVKAFAAALNRLKAEPGWRESLAKAGRARAVEKFGWGAKREILEKTYSELLGRRIE